MAAYFTTLAITTEIALVIIVLGLIVWAGVSIKNAINEKLDARNRRGKYPWHVVFTAVSLFVLGIGALMFVTQAMMG